MSRDLSPPWMSLVSDSVLRPHTSAPTVGEQVVGVIYKETIRGGRDNSFSLAMIMPFAQSASPTTSSSSQIPPQKIPDNDWQTDETIK